MKKEENRKKKDFTKGITLIALVITIIVLLILAGVTIATLIGENGILSKATEASNKTEEKNAEEEVKIAVMGSIGTNGELENEVLKENLNKIENISGVPEEIKDSSYPLTVTVEGKHSYTINKDGSIKEVPKREGIKVGDYVNYTYDEKVEGYNLLSTQSGYTSDQTVNQKSGMKWRVLNIHANGTVDLIGDVSSSDQGIYFSGALGYNNGVYLLNDICKELYSNSSLGVTARSINMEDIESQMNETGIAARDVYTYDGTQYGKTKTYTGSYANYPNLYAKEKGSGIDTVEVNTNGIEKSDNGYTSPTTESASRPSKSLTATETYYFFKYTPANYFKDYDGNSSIVKDILFNRVNYGLASRYVKCVSFYVEFGLCVVDSVNFTGVWLYASAGTSSSGYYRLRPIVTLGTDIKIEACKGENSSTNMHEISK